MTGFDGTIALGGERGMCGGGWGKLFVLMCSCPWCAHFCRTPAQLLSKDLKPVRVTIFLHQMTHDACEGFFFFFLVHLVSFSVKFKICFVTVHQLYVHSSLHFGYQIGDLMLL